MLKVDVEKKYDNPGLETIDEILDMTLPECLDRSEKYYGPLTAMRAYRNGKFEDITYLQFRENVYKLASGLIAQGIKPGDRVGILSENRPEWGMMYLAVLKAGGINVPLDSLLKPTEIRHIIRESGARCVATSSRFLPDFLNGDIECPRLDFLIGMDGAESIPPRSLFKVFSFDEIKQSGDEMEVIFPKVDKNDTVALLFTSGTTGQSKGVMLSHYNILSDINSVLKAIKFYTWDNFLSVLPIHHAFECTCGFLTPIIGGGSITYARSLKSKEIIEDIKDNQCTILIGVPLLFEKMHAGLMRAIDKKPRSTRIIFGTSLGAVNFLKKAFGYNAGGAVFKSLREKAGLSSLRLFVSGGAPLPPEIGDGFESLGIKFLQGYGLTETSPVLTLNPIDRPRHNSIGRTIPGAMLKLDNPDYNGVGELLAKGPMIMKGYYKNEKATREVFTEDGWFRTGDSARVDDDGYYYIAGRKKNLIVTKGGKNIYPEEIEQVLLRSPYIAEVLVMGGSTTEKQLVDSVEAIIYPDYEYLEQQAEIRGNEISETELELILKKEVSRLCADIADYKKVKSFRIREEEFNKTSTKKIKRYLFVQPSISVENGRNKK
ncbi:MAG: AMP-binding protein [candidate division Zixibacteria bacterium]|nr:AMP-binding protein [candidate division Zixibacteria bacterium]